MVSHSKPFKGHISDWRRVKVLEVGQDIADIRGDVQKVKPYYIAGRPSGHPEFQNWIRTSLVVSEKPHALGIEVETMNSRYILVGDANGVPPHGIQKP